MTSLTEIHFGPFRFYPADGHLKRGDEMAYLTPKDSSVLQTLAENAGDLVAKPDIIKRVWPGIAVSDDVLKACIKRIRKVLGDDYTAPRYIETVHRRGYRFICAVLEENLPVSCPARQMDALPMLVGRENELKQLEARLDLACCGRRQVVFVVGEAGIGKTTLLNAFSRLAQARCSMIAVQGQCIEHFGPGEGYRPILEALASLCGSEHGRQVVGYLKRFAPMWLVQMPWLISDQEREVLQKTLAGTTPDRMLRELTITLEVLSRDIPVLIYLEDLHWSDNATLDAINLITRRHDYARLMIVGTYRPEGLGIRNHPLHSIIPELLAHGYCRKIPLVSLSMDDIEALIRLQFSGHTPPHGLARWLLDHTAGNPLFINALLAHARDQGWLETEPAMIWRQPMADDVDSLVPANLRQMIENRLFRLPPV